MNNIYYRLIFLFLLFFTGLTYSQDIKSYDLDEVVITSGRIPLPYNDVIRNVVLLNAAYLESLPVENLQDVFNYSSSLDLKSRGPVGVQADVGMRGGTFEQTLILVDGIKINDAQTSHHNLNLPFIMNDIQKIEILKGQASSIFGPNAFSGVINFITKKNTKPELNASISGGSFGYYNGSLSAGLPLGSLSSRFSISKSKSDGYRHNTGFDANTFSFMSSLNTDAGRVNLFAGYTDKDFGANSFYSDVFPNQHERLKTLFTNITADLLFAGLNLSPKIYWRNNKDDYILDYTRPSFYRNIHTTDSYGLELQAYRNFSFGSIALGGELSKDEIRSTNLGNHQRMNWGVSSEFNSSPLENLNVVAGAFLYKYANFDLQFAPALDLGYNLTESLQLIASVGKSFRTPSYTDLYYNSPAQKGNATLQPETAITYEAGIKYRQGVFTFDAVVFKRDGNNIIDWAREPSTTVWFAQNISKIHTIGFESDIRIISGNESPVTNVDIGYTYLDSDIQTGHLQSRYVMDFLRHKVSIIIGNELPFGINQSWALRYCDRVNLEGYFITDIKVSKQISSFEISAEATNLFNESYSDFGSIPLPGRWVIAGVKFRLGAGN